MGSGHRRVAVHPVVINNLPHAFGSCRDIKLTAYAPLWLTVDLGLGSKIGVRATRECIGSRCQCLRGD